MSRFTVLRLYKQLVWAGRDYPAGPNIIRDGAKKAFLKMKDEKDPEKIKQAIAKGEYILKELEALVKLHKYRTLKRAYRPENMSIPGFTAIDKEIQK